MGIALFLPIIDKVLDFIPNPEARAQAQREMTLELVSIDAEQAKAQVSLNQTEAQHKSIFVAGWRPFIGWVGGIALTWQFILHPIVSFIAVLCGYEGILPELQTGELMSLVTAMLGIGTMRSFDKFKGTSTESIKPARKPKLNE